MPPLSLRDQHPEEARRLAELLKQLQRAEKGRSGLTQKDLAARLAISESAMSRYLKGDEVLPEASLDPFLDHTNADAEQRQQARTLMSTITGTADPLSPPALSNPPVPPTRPTSVVSGPRSTKRRLGNNVLRVGLAALVIYPALMASGTFTTERSVNCPGPRPSLPTAWAATCTGQAAFNRAQRELVVSDSDPEGSSVLVQVSLNGGEPTSHYNSTGLTTADKPPKRIPMPLVDDHTTVRFWVCLVNRNAKRAEGRRPYGCGEPVTDQGR